MPIMLRSVRCVLADKTQDQLAAMKECPYDPGLLLFPSHSIVVTR
jgi:DNA-directed RNA polymerase III subunit RPC2